MFLSEVRGKDFFPTWMWRLKAKYDIYVLVTVLFIIGDICLRLQLATIAGVVMRILFTLLTSILTARYDAVKLPGIPWTDELVDS